MTIVALGDSIMWGQGNLTANKFSSLVGASLGLPVVSYARSGSTLWDARERYPADLADARARLHLRGGHPVRAWPDDGERPAARPYVWEQLSQAAVDHRNADIVLVDGGANDVDFLSQIILPGRLPSEVARNIDRLKQPIEHLLRACLEAFPRAIVVCTSYYEAFTLTSDLTLAQVEWFLRGIGGFVPRSVVTNSMAFRVGFERAYGMSVDTINDARLRFAPPDFGADNGLFTGRSMMWEPGSRGEPVDDVVAVRAAMHAGILDRIVLDRASFGHPNRQGAKRYADAILSVLR